ncbi:MAG TPA: tetratricopeptide repeat protein [Terriglobales bacterium]|nr:tetratricopeptide repeat protein [Terriglobales bacterium]
MGGRVLAGSLLCLVVGAQCFAQGHSGGGISGTRGSSNLPNSTFPNTAPNENPSPSFSNTIFFSGKVALADGSELIEPAAIQMICGGQRHVVGYTDRKGSFSFQFADPNTSTVGNLADASTTMMSRVGSVQEQRNWRECELQAELAGFSSDTVELASRVSALESANIGTITLHRLEHVEGTSISVTSLAAPPKAKKELEKAREASAKGKWPETQKALEKAVQIYPKYAVAWYELGRVLLRQNDTAGAKSSFEKSVAADSKYVNAYEGLAELAFRASQWQEVVNTTNKLLALNPVNFPGAYLMSGAAQYCLGQMDAAEKISRAGIRADEAHQVPKLRYLLGMVLIRKREYVEATNLMQQYLSLANQPADVEEAKKQLAEIERLSAEPNSASIEDPKDDQ